MFSAQRRPGFEPRRHLDAPRGRAAVHRRSTKAGVRTPATPSMTADVSPALSTAQRRPGFEPRRHLGVDRASGWNVSAQRRPGFEPRRHTTAGYDLETICGRLAQRRPGFEPRRHEARLAAGRERQLRSTKAGVRTPATPALAVGGVDGQLIRSTKAGVRTPATHACASPAMTAAQFAQRRPGFEPRRHHATSPRRRPPCPPLNEGRGSNPGDTRGGTVPACRGEAKPQAAQSYSLRSPPSTSRLRTLAVSLGLACGSLPSGESRPSVRCGLSPL